MGRCPVLGIMLSASLHPGFISHICFHTAEHGDGTWEWAACSQSAEGPKPNTPQVTGIAAPCGITSPVHLWVLDRMRHGCMGHP